MSAEKLLYRHGGLHGRGSDLYFAWQTGGSAALLATTGSDSVVCILNRRGETLHSIDLSSMCAGFAWDPDGDLLAMICANSSQLLLWDANTQQQHTVDTGLRDPLTCLAWSRSPPGGGSVAPILAVGSARGNVALYNHQTARRTPILGKHSKRITCAAWSTSSAAASTGGIGYILALAGDDKTLSLSSGTGDSLRTVALRDTPSDMHFAAMKTDYYEGGGGGGSDESRTAGGDNTVSMILGARTLYLYHLPEPDAPTELGFQPKYGALVQHRWFGDGYVLLGFAHGYAVAISTHAREVGQELWQVRNHRDQLTAVAVSPASLGLLASAGGADGTVKVHAQANLKETVSIVQLPSVGAQGVRAMEWSADGQLMAVATQKGGLYVYVCELPALFAAAMPRVAVLSSLAEVTLYTQTRDVTTSSSSSMVHVVRLEIEPTFLAMGGTHLACGMNNHVWFYDLGRGQQSTANDVPMLLGDREYLAEIAAVRMNGVWCAVQCGGQVMLHAIEESAAVAAVEAGGVRRGRQQPQVFPGSVQGMKESCITCMALTGDFLVFATDLGNVVFFSLNSWLTVVRWRHSMGIKRLFCDANGTKVVLIDDHNQGHVFLPATEELILIADFPKNCTDILWDVDHANTFATVDATHCTTFVYVPHSVDGRHVCRIEPSTPLLGGKQPVALCDGDLILATAAQGGRLATVRLATHMPNADAATHFEMLLRLRRHEDAWALCRQLNTAAAWQQLAHAALSDLDTALALRAYRRSPDPAAAAMVLALLEVQHIEDGAFVAGTCARLLDQPDRAKAFFARSVRPLEALELCRDLLQCEQAMSLAETLAADQLPAIAREYAHQLEFGGQYAEALVQYERALQGDGEQAGDKAEDGRTASHRRMCRAGLARTSIKNGEHQRGVQQVLQLVGDASAAKNSATTVSVFDTELLTDCADALLAQRHTADAAALLERAGAWDRACQLYAELRAWPKVAALLADQRVTSSKLYAAYAQAMEQAGDYTAAVGAFRAAGDADSVVRVLLERLSDPHGAGELVLATRSVEGARQLARFYQQIGDTEQALQFLVLCGCVEDALALARRHNQMVRFAELLETTPTDDGEANGGDAEVGGGSTTVVRAADWRTVAEHFEAERHTLLAGKYYGRAGETDKALRLLLRAATAAGMGSAEERNAVQLAIECVARAHDERLAQQLIGFLLGDGSAEQPRDPKYLFRLYMARAQYREAAKTALIVGEQEQRAGNYRAAHGLLFGMGQELRRNGLAVGHEMEAQLVLLHRYALVRVHVKLGDHGRAARLLCLVAANVGQFPAHVVPILTSAVVECQRAGLASEAYTYAAMLMRAEYRGDVDPKYAKKIEAIVRKAPRDIKTAAATRTSVAGGGGECSPCPVCEAALGCMETVCHQCRSTLPVCVATGEHIALAGLAACPECDWPCFRVAMTKILDLTNQCPMCGEIVDSNRLTDVTDVSMYMNAN